MCCHEGRCIDKTIKTPIGGKLADHADNWTPSVFKQCVACFIRVGGRRETVFDGYVKQTDGLSAHVPAGCLNELGTGCDGGRRSVCEPSVEGVGPEVAGSAKSPHDGRPVMGPCKNRFEVVVG